LRSRPCRFATLAVTAFAINSFQLTSTCPCWAHERGRPRPQQRVLQKGVARASCPCFMGGTPMLRGFCSLGNQTVQRNLNRPFTERAGTLAPDCAHAKHAEAVSICAWYTGFSIITP
jgi:hypothetical protein